MEWERIRKRPEDYIGANLQNYDEYAKAFSWVQARSLLDGLPGGGINIAHEAVDRHVKAGRGGKLALRWIGRDDSVRDFTYAALGAAINRFANVLAQRGIAKGDRVSSLLGRVPELYIGALGTLKNGSVFSPMFSAFGPEPIKARMTIGNASALITTEAFYRRKVEPWRKELASLKHVFLTECSASPPPDTIDLAAALAQASDSFETVRTAPEDMALLHFTSGTTGKPKGAVHVHEAVVAHHITGRLALDLHADDIFWCTADPGWVTGTSYGIISPLTNGVTMIVDQAEFDAERWYRISAGSKSHCLVHGADSNPDADEGGRCDRQAVRLIEAAFDGERWRAAQSGSRGMGRRGFRQTISRQLVADRDRRNYDFEFFIDGREARLDGPPIAWHHGRRRRAS